MTCKSQVLHKENLFNGQLGMRGKKVEGEEKAQCKYRIYKE